MAGISFGGLASGLDTNSMITQLMAIERQPRNRLALREREIQARQTTLRDVSTRLTNLKSAAADLRSVGLWADAQTVDSSDAAKVAAERVSGAGPGGYQINVTQLARAAQRTYNYTASGSASQITIGAVAVDVAANATLDDVVAAINGNGSVGVYATNVSGQLVLSAKTTGVASDFTASGGTVAEDAAKAKAGLDASYTIDGGAPQTSATNVITSAIPGVKLTLKGVTASAVTVTVGNPGPNTTAIKDKIKAFVEQYNSTVEFVRGKITEKAIPNATTEADRLKGLLHGDTQLSGLLSQLRGALSETFAGNPSTIDELREVGVSTGATTGSGTVSASAISGKLVLDEAKLTEALNNSFQDVKRLFGAVTGVDGFAQRYEGILSPVLQADGVIPGRLTSADNELVRVRDAMTRMDKRLELKEQRLRAMFTALERSISANQTASAGVQAQLAGL